jgi:hypothetical protein
MRGCGNFWRREQERAGQTRGPPHSPISQRALEDAAVEKDVLAGDEAGVLRAHERGGGAEFVGLTEAAGRYASLARFHGLLDGNTLKFGGLLGRTAQAIRLEGAGQNVVDRNIMPNGLPGDHGNAAGETGAGAVRQLERGDGRLHRLAGDVEDAAELAIHHAVDRRLDQRDGRDHVPLDSLAPIVEREVLEVARGWATRVVDEDVGSLTTAFA